MKFLSSSAWRSIPGAVRTSSRIRKWWLTTVRGYTIEKSALYPRKYAGGRMKYSRYWVLKP